MYNIFVRTWWKENKNWPGGLEPHTGRRVYLRQYNPVKTEGEARHICKEYNKTHNPGRYSSKAEYESI